MKHIISVLVENRFGVLARVSGLFSARGYNISSLAVGETEDPAISRMTIVVKGDDKILEQVKKQLNKLIDIILVKDYIKKEHIDRELVLFKVLVNKQNNDKVMEIFKASPVKIIQTKEDSIVVEIVGSQDEIDKLSNALNKFEIKEMVRTGRIAMEL
ncbi:MAG: acetolactate synthase small subunit [Candidatus Orphnella occulta]|nr:acetolactate synthase small subunit [Candidatus Orphnella occulta]